MHKAILGFHFFALSLYAGDPGYFTETAKGVYFRDLVSRETVELVPGTLIDCKQTASFQTYNYWDCKAQGMELRIQANGKTFTFPFDTLTATEYQYNPAEPSSMTYSFQGTYQEALPDGSTLDSITQLSLSRNGGTPNRIRGQVYLNSNQFGMSIQGAVAMEIPTPPAVP